MKKIALCLILVAALVGPIGMASAEGPMALNADQMDQVTAAGGGLVNFTDGLSRVAGFQSGLASRLFASLVKPSDETVESPFGSINRKINEIRERTSIRDIKLSFDAIPD